MSLTVTESINLEVVDERRIIFTTAADRKVTQTGFDELFSARVDVPASTTLYKLPLGGIEESYKLYFRTTKAMTMKLVPVGGSEGATPLVELIPDTPNYVGFKLAEVWIGNPNAEAALLTIASVGKNA